MEEEISDFEEIPIEDISEETEEEASDISSEEILEDSEEENVNLKEIQSEEIPEEELVFDSNENPLAESSEIQFTENSSIVNEKIAFDENISTEDTVSSENHSTIP